MPTLFTRMTNKSTFLSRNRNAIYRGIIGLSCGIILGKLDLSFPSICFGLAVITVFTIILIPHIEP